MAIRKNTKAQTQTIFQEVSTGSDLSLRLEKVSEQTGLSPQSLLQKWILQEETLIGLMRHGKEQVEDKAPISKDAADRPAIRKKKAESVQPDTSTPKDRKTLAKRAHKLKREPITLKKIAEIFNDEKIPTVSGTGKWYASSVTNLLKSKV
jgi:hypothetical protein